MDWIWTGSWFRKKREPAHPWFSPCIFQRSGGAQGKPGKEAVSKTAFHYPFCHLIIPFPSRAENMWEAEGRLPPSPTPTLTLPPASVNVQMCGGSSNSASFFWYKSVWPHFFWHWFAEEVKRFSTFMVTTKITSVQRAGAREIWKYPWGLDLPSYPWGVSKIDESNN